jgi:hypothetical protein
MQELYSVYFSDFAIPATVAGVALNGIFDKAYQESYGIVAGDNPVLLIQSSLVTPIEGDAVIVNSTNYTVASVEPDGQGVTVLQLELA